MKDQIIVSAKNLGGLARPKFCERCFWIKLKLGTKLPFQIFPGIFSSIDSYSKKLVHSWFDKHNGPPAWLARLDGITGYREPPNFREFYVVDEKSGVRLRGEPDAVFTRNDGSYVIADYKTAKYTETQDELLPLYEVQLNSYAFIGENYGFSPVSELALIYTQPVTDHGAAARDENHVDDGFLMGFSAYIHRVGLDLGMIQPLLAKVREIYDLETIPPHTDGCKDCKNLEGLIEVVRASSG